MRTAQAGWRSEYHIRIIPRQKGVLRVVGSMGSIQKTTKTAANNARIRAMRGDNFI